jgi:hypothetical protein
MGAVAAAVAVTEIAVAVKTAQRRSLEEIETSYAEREVVDARVRGGASSPMAVDQHGMLGNMVTMAMRCDGAGLDCTGRDGTG